MDDKKRDKYLQKKYGITLAEYNTMVSAQGNGCAICGQEPRTRSLAVDHSHGLARAKIHVLQYENKEGFYAWVQWEEVRALFKKTRVIGCSKKEVRIRVKEIRKRLSIRGLLCSRCNRGLQYFSDTPQRLISAANYLKRFKERLEEGETT